MLGIVRTRIVVSLCVFFISEKSIGYFYALSVFWLRVFYIAGILKIEKTFGGDAEISFTF